MFTGDGSEKNDLEHTECPTNLYEEYSYYLAFENHICPDYITEKFFRNAVGRKVGWDF